MIGRVAFEVRIFLHGGTDGDRLAVGESRRRVVRKTIDGHQRWLFRFLSPIVPSFLVHTVDEAQDHGGKNDEHQDRRANEHSEQLPPTGQGRQRRGILEERRRNR